MKKKLIIPISLVLVILIAVIYVSYGFVAARITNNELSKKQTFMNQKLEIEYSDGTETLTSNNASFIPGSILEKEISITNTGNVPVTYTIKIGDCLPEDESKCVFENTFKRPADITYEMYLNDEIIEKTTFPIYKDEPLASNITIDKNETQNLKLLIYYNNSTDNQIVDSGSKIGGKLTFEDEKNIIENVLIYGNTDENTSTSLGESDVITLSVNRNLVKNGFGEYGDNTNFTAFNYLSEDKFSNLTKGSFNFVSNKYKNYFSEFYIPVDTTKTYTLSTEFKDLSNISKNYLGFASYDVDKNVINSENIMYIKDSLTYLVKDLKKGDTEIHLNSTDGFVLDEETPEYQRGLIFWDYVDSTGKKYLPETYSKNIVLGLYNYNMVNAGVIKLESGWTGREISAGTYVSQSSRAEEHTYSLCQGCNFVFGEWVNKKKYIEGIFNYSNTGNMSHNKFRIETKYIKLFYDNAWELDGYDTNLIINQIYFGRDDMKIEYTINLSSPLSCFDGICDYIDVKNKRIVRKSDAVRGILKTPEYEEIDVPDLSLFTSKMITVSDGTLEASDIKVEYK